MPPAHPYLLFAAVMTPISAFLIAIFVLFRRAPCHLHVAASVAPDRADPRLVPRRLGAFSMVGSARSRSRLSRRAAKFSRRGPT